MLEKRKKKILIIAAAIFFFSQPLIFASIPRNIDSSPHSIVVKNGTSISGIAQTLKDEGLIYSKVLFKLTSLMYKGRLMAGEYELRRDMSTLGIVMKMGRGERNIYALRIIEGYNIYSIAESIDRSSIMAKDDFLRLARDRDYLERIGVGADSLEGYLFADTYHYSKEVDVETFIERIVRRTFAFFDREDVRERMDSLNLDIHRTLTLASMIEKEAGIEEEKPFVSAVFHNRTLRGMSFDSDPTVIYGTKRFGLPIRRVDLDSYTPYNTYTFRGYPKGPICSPAKSTIMATLNPASVDYLFFVSKNDGSHVFSRDIAEHNRYVNMYQRSGTTKQ